MIGLALWLALSMPIPGWVQSGRDFWIVDLTVARKCVCAEEEGK